MALDLYGGVPGVVLFFVQAYPSTRNAAHLDEARAGADFLLSKANSVSGMGLKAYLEFSRRVAARLLAKATIEDGRMSWLQAEHRTRPDYRFAQTDHIQGAAGIGTFLLRQAVLDRPHPQRIVFPDTPFTR